MKKIAMIALGAALVMPAAFVQAKGEVELGYSKSTGNSDNEKLAAALGLASEFGQYKNHFLLSANNASDDGARSEERYAIADKLDYNISDRSYTFARAAYEQDKFSGFDEEMSLAAGLGHHFIKSETKNLTAEIGPGYKVLNPEIGDVESNAMAYAAEKFDWQFSDSASFHQALSVEASDNTVTELSAAVKSKLTDTLALKVYAKGTHYSEAPKVEENGVQVDGEDLFTETGVSLNYEF